MAGKEEEEEDGGRGGTKCDFFLFLIMKSVPGQGDQAAVFLSSHSLKEN